MTHTEHFEQLIREQLERVERMKNEPQAPDFESMDKIVIGAVDGDGIGPIIMDSCRDILAKLLADEIAAGKIEIRTIKGLTIENRAAKLQAVPDDVLAEIKECDVLLKGPTMTPGQNDNVPNIESANVKLRKELDLFANVRPVVIPEKGIDWMFFRENTEGEYALGSRGLDITEDMSMDFKVTTTEGTRRLARAAFEYARKNGNRNVTIVTKANIMKKTDGKFLKLCYEMAEEYPEIKTNDRYVDIMSANLINDMVNKDFNVVILPNLYGDIITDEAAQMQGGVGTAGSANIGSRYAMFEAIHGSAERMIREGRGQFANPASICRAAVMMLRHIGYAAKAETLETALDKAAENINIVRDGSGHTAGDFTKYVLEVL